ncbi:hypothetical protein FBU59_001380, partial [Linderina macrospora]
MSSMSSARMLSRSVAAAASHLSAARRIHSLARPAISALPRSTMRAQTLLSQGFRRRLSSTSATPQAEPQRAGKEGAKEDESAKEEDSTHHAVVSTFDLFSIGVGPSS